MADDVFTGKVWSVVMTGGELDMLTVEVKDGTWSLTGINGRLLEDDSGMLTGEVDLDTGKVDKTRELTLLVNDLTTYISGFSNVV